MANGKEKQRRQNDGSETSRGEGPWWKRDGQKPSGRSQYHEDVATN
jgi:hypothetical protein